VTARFAGLGALGVAIVAIVVLLASGGAAGYQIKINLPDADGLRPGSHVEIGGVSVGNVNSLKITGQDHALATITINRADAPIGTNASVVIRPADLLGEKYLDLSVGNIATPARSGFTIPADRTQDATDLDQVLDVLAPTVRDRLAIMIHESGVALFGRGADLKAALASLPPSVADATDLINQINASNAQLKALLTHAGQVLVSLTAQHQAVARFVSTAANALSATAANTEGLRGTVAAAPGAVAQLRTTLARLDLAGAALRPAASGLISTAPALTATLQALPGFTVAALPTLAEARGIAPQLTELGRRASPVIAALEPTSKDLDRVAGDAAPITATLDSSVADLLGLMQNWARAIQFRDGASHEFRVSTEVTPALIKELLPLITAGTNHKRNAKPVRGKKPRPNPLTNSLSTVTNKATKTLTNALGPETQSLQMLLKYLLGK
jgi:phospholipid/cholesterol/gamma-HCH transport system substrate-binding protein